eukprot:c14697_g1_i1.p1 GENE.c14697_g1_i1~~c14697_g1_i1.p1  ORF type:complete len:366 (+),score=153.40 c14697_g1_i1:91-1188(+)
MKQTVIIEIKPSSQSCSPSTLINLIKSCNILKDIEVNWFEEKICSEEINKKWVIGHSYSSVLLSCGVGYDEWSTIEENLINTIKTSSKDVSDIEVVLTAPSYVPLKDSFFDSLCVSFPHSKIDEVYDHFTETGILCVTSTIQNELLNKLILSANKRIEQADSNLKEKFPNTKVGVDEICLLELGSRGGQRFDLLFDENDPSSQCVRDLISTGSWVPLISRILGPNFKCQVSVIYSRPGAPDQSWHSDGDHLGRDADISGHGEDSPYAVCVFVPLIDLSDELGFTQFWVGSHKSAGLIGFGAAAEMLNGTINGIVKAGQAVIYDYRLMHRGMANKSTNTERALLQFVYHTPSYREVKNYGTQSLFN